MLSPFDGQAIKEMFKRDDGLVKLVVAFNASPAGYAHDSWFDDILPAELLHILQRSPRALARLSRLLLDVHDLEGEEAWQAFCHPLWRLALLPPAVISRLTRFGALAFQHKRLAMMVGNAAITKMKRDIGQAAYHFAIKRAPLLVGNSRGIDLDPDLADNFDRYLRCYGAVYFLSHFQDAPKALAGRLALKFERSHAAMAARFAPQKSGWPLFKRILIHEIDPQWQFLFN